MPEVEGCDVGFVGVVGWVGGVGVVGCESMGPSPVSSHEELIYLHFAYISSASNVLRAIHALIVWADTPKSFANWALLPFV